MMRAVIQRVSSASVEVEKSIVGKINKGLLLFIGIEKEDTKTDFEWLAQKIPSIRCFEDEDGKMNLSLNDIAGDILVISQFTLYGHLKKGTRPSFNRSARPDKAMPLYESFIDLIRKGTQGNIATGVFGADMKVEAHNDGPVTLIIDSAQKDL